MTVRLHVRGVACLTAHLRSLEPKDTAVTDTPATPAPEENLLTEALEVAEDEAAYLAAKRRLEEATARYEATRAKGKPISEVVAASNGVAVEQAVVSTAEPATGPEVDPVVETPAVDVGKLAPVAAPVAETPVPVAPAPTPAPAPETIPAASPIVPPEEASAKAAVESAAVPAPIPEVVGAVDTTPVAPVAVAAAPAPPAASPTVAPAPVEARHAYRPLKTGKRVASPDGRKSFNFATSTTGPLMVDETAVFPTPLSDADEAAYLANPAGELAAMSAKYGAPTYETNED